MILEYEIVISSCQLHLVTVLQRSKDHNVIDEKLCYGFARILTEQNRMKASRLIV